MAETQDICQDLRERARLHVLYRWYDEFGGLLYVGLTADPGNRINAHRRRSAFFREAKRMEMEHFASRSELEAAESRAIKDENPQYNIAGTRRAARKTETADPVPGSVAAPRLAPLDVSVLEWLVAREPSDFGDTSREFLLLELGLCVFHREIGVEERATLRASLHRLRAMVVRGDDSRQSRLIDGVGREVCDSDHYLVHLTDYVVAQDAGFFDRLRAESHQPQQHA